MSLKKTERLLISNQNRILAILNPANAKEHILHAEIAEYGYVDLYDELFEEIFEETSEEVCTETTDILNMYRAINGFISSIHDQQIDEGDLEKIQFTGFDGNHDRHYHYMHFLVEKADRYNEYKNRDYNSHNISSIVKYKKMLPVYTEVINSNDYQINLAGLKKIINSVD
jgi:uncharacterized protein YfbU (UPF0304 family)